MSDRRNVLDQCPSSHKEGKPVATPASARALSAATGKSYWRSLDDLAGTKDFRSFVEREFPAMASELLDGSRRHFLRIMGASLALAGAATVPGCRRPDHKILAYNRQPEDVIPGVPLFYATAMPLPGGSCEGLLAETYEGRPTKLEGNPLHPENRGKSSVRAQAAILDLYDPDRGPAVAEALTGEAGAAVKATPLADAVAQTREAFAQIGAAKGRGLAFLVEKTTSPSRDALRDRVLSAGKWPEARWFAYEAIDNEGELAATRAVLGGPAKALHDFSQARVVVSLGHDFLTCGAGVSDSRGFAAARYRDGDAGHEASGSSMSRLYVFESMLTLTGGQADHRWAVRPSRIAACAMALARAVASKLDAAAARGLTDALGRAAASDGAGVPSADVFNAIADDLLNARGTSLLAAGEHQPAQVHALVAALNAALGNVGRTVRYVPLKGDAGQSSLASIRALKEAIDAGQVSTLVVVGANPVYSAPADLAFAESYAKVPLTVHLGEADETAAASKIHVARTHFLESWGDVETWDGVYSVVQPMIDRLYAGTASDLELLASLAGESDTDPYFIVRNTVRARAGNADFEKLWRRTLHDGMSPAGQPRGPAMAVDFAGVARALAEPLPAAGDGLEILFLASPQVHDGRMANNGWLQELPDAVTKLTWDNAILMNPATAQRLGFSTDRHPVTPQYCHGEMMTLSVGGRSVDAPLWPQPGLADDTVAVHLGYGRRVCGRVARGSGFDFFGVRPGSGQGFASGVTVEAARGKSPYLLATTQDHWTLEGRDILREVDLPRWQKFGDIDYLKAKDLQKDPYDRTRRLNFAGLLGMESHTPANVDMYEATQKNAYALRFTEEDENGNPLRDEKGNIVPIKNVHGKPIQQWGMSIDLTTCTGCGACMVACQAENNVPIVGKKEVAKGREMHWIRVDRYYSTAPTSEAQKDTLGVGDDSAILADADMMVMPVTCVHCENAPCEVVCPVNATVHDEQGNNNMAYNRCIGTRYCSNNCPYKVRRFNFFDYATKQFRGNFAGKDLTEKLPEIARPPSEHFVPPRLRQKKLEVATMQHNPHVTVRSRGVMEKCTYCIQRVNAARVETKLADLNLIPDGFVQTACQQACPTDAIVFGDIYDSWSGNGAGSRVKQKRGDGRSYQLLAYLNTRPRTTHMLRIRNPNPALVDASRRARWDHPLGHGHGGSDHSAPHGSGGHEAKPEGHVMSLPILTPSRGALA
ncbi:MAG: TAT-variant-translocated molybdopterin oxidoreductase [Planctomycetota bacterium]|nr:TAT-variant-translocated molybdopterin oxidoreductase [Planctomycetota bacterium]